MRWSSVTGANDLLEMEGPTGRPVVDKVNDSTFSQHEAELRPAGTSIRSCSPSTRPGRFPLLGGDKAGNWKRWYDNNIPIADQRLRTGWRERARWWMTAPAGDIRADAVAQGCVDLQRAAVARERCAIVLAHHSPRSARR